MKPISVNFHLWKPCNYNCQFCFATFGEISSYLSIDDAKYLLKLLRNAGTEKINFAGGEPTLHPYINEIVAEASRLGFTVSIVTNGARLSQLLKNHATDLDWVALSVDSASEVVQAALGRGKGNHVRNSIALFDELRQHNNIHIKLNTVITSLNYQEDMSDFIRRVRPERWKVFQVLPVEGQNDGSVEDLLISTEQFEVFVKKHLPLAAEGFAPIIESNNLMKDSYVMINPQGQFYSGVTGRYLYSESIIKVGVEKAMTQIGWNVENFLSRGGIYAWN